MNEITEDFREPDERGKVHVDLAAQDYHAWVVETPAGTFDLICFDYVVNEWTESYPKLSIALARLALLVACGEGGFEVGFAAPEAEFPAAFERFVTETTT